MWSRLALIASLAMVAAAVAPIWPAKPAEPIDVALVLAVDVSASMDADEQRVQRQGYVDALTDPQVLRAIALGTHGKIAVAYVEWSGEGEQTLVLPWTLIDGPETAAVVASRLSAERPGTMQRTSISGALVYGAELLSRVPWMADRRVIDVSGDGPNNAGMPVTKARDEVVSQGIVINGLPLLMKVGKYDFVPDLDAYYEDCVIGGEGSFMIPVNGMENFGAALKMKLVMEIAGLDWPRVMRASGRRMTDCATQ